jgi:hypothetical protein
MVLPLLLLPPAMPGLQMDLSAYPNVLKYMER